MSEKFGYQTEVKQLLHLVIHSLYSDKEIFLRELVSNAADAIDKLRFAALSDAKLTKGDSELRIRVECDAQKKQISIIDNGIGMSREEVISNLGTIAKSGTADFLAKLNDDQKKNAELIGQFGVGFYSSFIVADNVEVFTRRADLPADQGVHWQSNGADGYELDTWLGEQRGTTVVLHLNKEQKDFAEEYKLRSIIKKYSDHLSVPVQLPKKDDDGKVVKGEFETVNQAKSLWTRGKTEISNDEYQEFYKHISHDFENALTWSHNKKEGKLEYTFLLYIPKRAPFDLYDRSAPRGLQLYVQRVFILDNAEQFLPLYLRFVRGVVDSSDLSLNISREILQQDKSVDTMKAAITKAALDVLNKLAKKSADDYQVFWETFGQVFKEGIGEDFTNKEKISALLRFSSTAANNATNTVALEQYVDRMTSDQQHIYYLVGDSWNAVKSSPLLEVFRKNDIEVLLLNQPIDEWMMGQMPEFADKKFKDISKGDTELTKNSKDEQSSTAEDDSSKDAKKELLERIKTVLADQVEEVKSTNRLVDSPACLLIPEHAMGEQMRRLMAASGQVVPKSKPILEINDEHQLIRHLHATTEDEQFATLANIVFDQATLASGRQLDDPVRYVNRINEYMVKGLS